MITIVSWRWTDGKCDRRFDPEFVNVHRAMIARNLKQEHRYVCITDNPDGIEGETYPLWDDLSSLYSLVGRELPSCYKRLKIFDGATTRAMGIADGERVVSVDLDVVITGQLDPLFDRPENFVGWKVPGGRHRTVLNGTIFMQRAARMEHVWNQFDPRVSPGIARSQDYFGTDQAWLSYLLARNCAGWTRHDGVMAYSTDCRLIGRLPSHAVLVSFHGGKRNPWDASVQREAPWIKNYWRV